MNTFLRLTLLCGTLLSGAQNCLGMMAAMGLLDGAVLRDGEFAISPDQRLMAVTHTDGTLKIIYHESPAGSFNPTQEEAHRDVPFLRHEVTGGQLLLCRSIPEIIDVDPNVKPCWLPDSKNVAVALRSGSICIVNFTINTDRGCSHSGIIHHASLNPNFPMRAGANGQSITYRSNFDTNQQADLSLTDGTIRFSPL